MDPSANQAEQLTLARSIIAALDNPDAWAVVEHDDGCYYLERGRDRLGPYSRQDALDDAATRNDDDTITADADRLAELVVALHDWRAGFTVQGEVEAERTDIHELLCAVREHPDFVFGAVFTRNDFDDPDTGEAREIPESFNAKVAEETLVERGNALIDDAGVPSGQKD